MVDSKENNMINVIKEKMTNQILKYSGQVEDYHSQFFKENFFDDFSNILKKTGALLAGGSLLASIHNYIINDYDLYVQSKNAKALLLYLKGNLGLFSSNGVMAPPYDQSFFRKNNILLRIPLWSGEVNFDVMIIPDDIEPKNVVKNFDLTFCEIWYDGTKIEATDMNGVKEKKGYLRKEYEESLLQHLNPFIIKRIKKYTKRGFNIKYNCPDKIINIDISSKKVVSPEDWVWQTLYKEIFRNTGDFLQRIEWFQKNSFKITSKLSLDNIAIEAKKNSGLTDITLKDYYAALFYNIGIQWTLPKEYLEYINKVLDISVDYIKNSRDTAEQIEKARKDNIEEGELNFKMELYKAKNLWQKINDFFYDFLKSSKHNIDRINNIWESTGKYIEDNVYNYLKQNMFLLINKNTAVNYLTEINIKNIKKGNIDKEVIETAFEKYYIEKLQNEDEDEDEENVLHINISSLILKPIISEITKIYNSLDNTKKAGIYSNLIYKKFIENAMKWLNLESEITQVEDINLSINIIEKYVSKIKDLDFKNTDEKILVEEFEKFLIQENVHNNEVNNLFETFINNINKVLTDKYLNDVNLEVLSNIEIDEKKLPDECFDLIMFVNENNIDHINMSDTFILVVTDINGDHKLVCYDLFFLRKIIRNRRDNWFYECTGKIIPNTQDRAMKFNDISLSQPYLKIPIDLDGYNVYVPLGQVKTMLLNIIYDDVKVFYVTPHNIDGVQQMITHTASYKNVFNDIPDGVSANHCQGGSSILIYDIAICTGKNCKLTKHKAKPGGITKFPEHKDEKENKENELNIEEKASFIMNELGINENLQDILSDTNIYKLLEAPSIFERIVPYRNFIDQTIYENMYQTGFHNGINIQIINDLYRILSINDGNIQTRIEAIKEYLNRLMLELGMLENQLSIEEKAAIIASELGMSENLIDILYNASIQDLFDAATNLENIPDSNINQRIYGNMFENQDSIGIITQFINDLDRILYIDDDDNQSRFETITNILRRLYDRYDFDDSRYHTDSSLSD